MPRSSKKGWTDWAKSQTKHTIIQDLADEVTPIDASPEEAWECHCMHLPEVKAEKAICEQFEFRFKDHKKQISKKKIQALAELVACRRHRELHPSQIVDHNGDLIWDNHPAELLLREDVRNNMHKQMLPAALQRSRRDCWPFDPKVFRRRICQEKRRQKFECWLSLVRAAKVCVRKQQADAVADGVAQTQAAAAAAEAAAAAAAAAHEDEDMGNEMDFEAEDMEE